MDDNYIIINEYLDKKNWRIKENSNFGYSISGLQSHVANKVISDYTLDIVYNPQIKRAYKQNWIHIHDLSQGVAPYCSGWSVEDILLKGFGGVEGKIDAAPAKHYDSLLGQLVNFIGTLQNEFSGAQALNSFDTWLAPFVKEDKLTYKEVKQGMQEFIYGINQSSRWSLQTPFTNLSFDLIPLVDLKDRPCIVGGQLLKYCYKDCQTEMDMINKAFMEIMLGGDAKGRIFTFPIPTYNITKEFDWDGENSKLLFQMTSKYGIPYFQNFINSDLSPDMVRSMCCRLRLSLKELEKKTGGLFGSGSKTGSIGVVTLNLAKMGMVATDEKELFKLIDKYVGISKDSLEIKRNMCNEFMDDGLFPYSKEYLKSFKTYYSTIGVVGGHECCLNFLGESIESDDGKTLMIKILEHIKNLLSDIQVETKNLYNLEATPAEGVSYRMAKNLRKEFGEDIMLSGTKETPFLTNSTNLPVDADIDVFDALLHQNELLPLYTGGSVFHCFLGERVDDWRTTRNLVKRVCESTNIPFFSITPTFSVCSACGYLSGEHKQCPTCNKYCEVYSRVVGYLRPVKQWNPGKQVEMEKRKTFTLKGGVMK